MPLKHAEKVKKELQELQALVNYRPVKEEGHIYFPVDKEVPYTTVEKEFEPKEDKTLRSILEPQLAEDEKKELITSFDIVGSIAMIEVPEILEKKKHIIGEAILQTNPNISTVLKKVGSHIGELRTQKMEFLAGEDTRETITVENGTRLKINVEEVYYSVRTATERKRISDQVKPGETILVMFSGAAPYPCVLGKNTEASEIIGVELNTKGHELGLENIQLNKLKHVALLQGDVRKVVPKLQRNFDRIIMPLPHTGHDFLDEAFTVAKKGTTIHLYDFETENEFEKAAEKVKQAAQRNKIEVEIHNIIACGQHSPRTFRVCVDFSIA